MQYINILSSNLDSISKDFTLKMNDFTIYSITVTILLTILLILIVNADYQIGTVEAQLTNASSIPELIDKGDLLFNQGRYKEAITYFDKALALDPNDTDALYYKGISLESQGRHDEAITYFDKVLALDPNNENTLGWKEHTLRKMGMHNDTVTNLDDQVYSIDTNNTELNDAKDKAKGIIKYILNTIFPQTGEKFSNTNYGVDMTFPKNWTGFEMKIILPMAVVSPEGFNISSLFSRYIDSLVENIEETIISNNTTELSDQQLRQLLEPKVRESAESLSKNLMDYMLNKTFTMEIAIYDKELMQLITSLNPNITMSVDSLTSLYEQLVASDPTFSCDRKTLNQTVLNNNISAEVSTEECLLAPSNKYIKNLNYLVLTPNAIVGIHYSTDSNIENDKYLSKFEESLKSLSVEGSLPINNQNIQQFLDTKVSTSLSTNTSSISELIEKGDSVYNLAKYEEAVAWYDKALAIVPTNVDALFKKGISLGSLGKNEEAIKVFDKILEVDPRHAQALGNKGVALANLGRHNESIIWYDKSLEVDPTDVNSLTYKGAALGDLGIPEQAITWFDKALEVEPKFTAALYNKASALSELGRYEEALSSYDKVLNIEPMNPDALENKAIALHHLGMYEEAIVWYDKALELDPKDVYLLNNKGSSLWKLGKYEEAIVWFDKALEVDPKNVDALTKKGAVFFGLGKKQDALELLDKALTIDPTNQIASDLKSFLQK